MWAATNLLKRNQQHSNSKMLLVNFKKCTYVVFFKSFENNKKKGGSGEDFTMWMKLENKIAKKLKRKQSVLGFCFIF